MNESEYYASVFDKLKNCFNGCHYALGYGRELIQHGWDPNKLSVTAEPIDQLWKLAVEWNLQVYIPVIGFGGNQVLFSKDAEISLSDPYDLYGEIGSQWHYFNKHMKPVILFETSELERLEIPHIVDLTPSGWHILFLLKKATSAYQQVRDIGWLEDDLRAAYNKLDPDDIKRNPAVGEEAGSVYSGIGRLKEYMALKAKQYVIQFTKLPITISDAEEKCVNEDITDVGDSGFMRIMRSPFGLHKKRREFFPGCESMQDVIMRYYSGSQGSPHDILVDDLRYLLECMWDKEKAVKHIHKYEITGHIPVANDEGITRLVNQYKYKEHGEESDLYKFHKDFDNHPELEPGEAFHRAKNDHRLSEKSKELIYIPCPRALQPSKLKKFVRNLFWDVGWHPKHIGCLINDFYNQNHEWGVNWMKYPSRTRANFWARIYSAVVLLEEGELKV